MQNRTSIAIAAFAAAVMPVVASASVVINDNFQVNSAADYTIVNDGTSPNGSQAFAFDYAAAGIPLAPRSAPGGGSGLRLTANNSAVVTDSWTLFHKTPVNAPQYKLEVDVWMNFAVATASTEYAQIGVGGNGTTFNSVFTPVSGSGAFLAFTGDGGSASDYRWFRDAANSFADDPATAPAIPSTTLANTHPSYLGNGSNNTNAFFSNLFPLAPRTAPSVVGSPGNMWTTVTIDVDNIGKVISFYMSNPGTNTNALVFKGSFVNNFHGLVSVGINDPFTSVDAGSVFTLYDNLTVTVVPEPTALSLVAGAGLLAMRRRTAR
jgi:hypothetical protein